MADIRAALAPSRSGFTPGRIGGIMWHAQRPFIREKFTREQSFARKLAKAYFERFPKDRFQTEIERWRKLQSFNIEFTMKRLREPIEADRS
jgi:hypothetical protein